MKNLWIVLVLSLLFQGLHAQNYQTVNSGRIAYFSFNSFSALKIDSTKVLNGDSVFYPSRSFGGFDYRCFSAQAPSWSGSKIIVRPDGTNIYFNENNDSIAIETQAGLNESWIAFQRADSITIRAEVVECLYDTVLGMADSVKTIQFQVLDSVGQPVDDPVNQMQLQISKHFGWKKALCFNLFPNLDGYSYKPSQYFQTGLLVGLTNPRVGRQNLTWFDVYDFQPGDVLHVYEAHYGCCGVSPCKHYYNRFIYIYLNRNEFPDSIVYRVDRVSQRMVTQYPDTVSTLFEHDTIWERITPNRQFDVIPGELVPIEGQSHIRLTRQFNKGGLEYKDLAGYFAVADNASCWRMLHFDGGGSYDYIQGLGGGYYEYDEICEGSLRELQYYKKGNKEWGTPFHFTGVETVQASANLRVYPNPVSEILYIETFGRANPVAFELFSVNGSRVLKHDFQGENPQIDVRALNPGLYFYSIQLETGQQLLGKIAVVR
jgi:hypothetical protein